MKEEDITLGYLQKGRVARSEVLQNGISRWYVGVIDSQRNRDLKLANNTFHITYLPTGSAKAEHVQLLMSEYGLKKKWVLLMKEGEEER